MCRLLNAPSVRFLTLPAAFRLTVVGRMLVPVAMVASTAEVGTPAVQFRGLVKAPSPPAPVHTVCATAARGVSRPIRRGRWFRRRKCGKELVSMEQGVG